MSPHSKSMFNNDELPNELSEGTPTNDSIPQTATKNQLLKELLEIKALMNEASLKIAESPFTGKKHPGLYYLSAS